MRRKSIIVPLIALLSLFLSASGFASSHHSQADFSFITSSKNKTRISSSGLAGQLSNSSLILTVSDEGNFTLQTLSGRYLLYPKIGTSYLSVKLNDTSSVYTTVDGTLPVNTPFTITSQNTGNISYKTPENVIVTQQFTLQGEAVEFSVQIVNQDTVSHDVSVRYLLDTQVDINDGSPLYTPSAGVRINETNVSDASFSTWRGYDQWPEPTLTAVGTLTTQPNAMMLAWWPVAYQTPWDYQVNSSQAFFTPGYTTSPQSDSCVLLYFNLGTVPSTAHNTVSTFYGIGEPTGSPERERLISAIKSLRDATKGATVADLDAFAALQATYITAMRISWKDLLNDVWSFVDVHPNITEIARLGKGYEVVEKSLKIIDTVSTANDTAKAMGEVTSGIPLSANENAIANGYIKPYFINKARIGSYSSINEYLATIDSDYNSIIQEIPDPLPQGYQANFIIQLIQQQVAAINASTREEASVPAYMDRSCSIAKLGALQINKRAMKTLAESNDTLGNVSFTATVVGAGSVLGAATIKVAGLAGAPLTVGGSLVLEVPSEAVLWGGAVAINTATSTLGTGVSVASMSIQAMLTKQSYDAVSQFSNDLALRRAIFKSTKGILTLAMTSRTQRETLSNASLESIQVVTVSTPDVIIADDQVAGQGTGYVTVRNNGDAAINANVYGDITASIGDGMPIIGLVGSTAIEINPGSQQSIPFSYSVLRSTMIHHSGYFLDLFVTVAGSISQFKIYGPHIAHFFAGTNTQLAILNRQSFSIVAQGSLAEGGVASYTTSFHTGTDQTRLLLSFPQGSDYDLHLYDPQGNHVGVNYSTGSTENNVPSVSYSGSTAWPEAMTIDRPSTDTYALKVVAENDASGNDYSVVQLESALLPALLEASPRVDWNMPNPTWSVPLSETFGLNIGEGGGNASVSNIQAITTNLTSTQGISIPAASITCTTPATILGGEKKSAACIVRVVRSVPAGEYYGSIKVSGSDSEGNELNATTLIRLLIPGADNSKYLPIVAKPPITPNSNATPTDTQAPVNTLTIIPTVTNTRATSTAIATATNTSTPTSTNTPTKIPSITITPTYTSTPTNTPISASCMSSSNTWQYASLTVQTGTFAIEFDATPNSNKMNALVGLSAGQPVDLAGLATTARFYTNGYIDARNGGVYTATTQVAYQAGTSYHFRMEVNVPSHTYTIYVTPQGSSTLLLGSNFAFREQQSAVTYLDNAGVYAIKGSLQVCNILVVP